MLTCPRCGKTLKALRRGPKVVWGCAECGGRAAAFALLRESIAHDRWKALQHAVAMAAKPSSRRCPSCRNPMLEADAEGVAVETCRRCQLLWFDRWEAPEPAPRPALSPEAAETAARFEVASIERRGRMAADAAESLGGVRGLIFRFGFPVEIEAPPTAIVPWTTIALTLVVIAIGLLTLGDPRWIVRLGFIPSAPLRYGGATLATSFLVHGGLLHLFGNAYFLAIFGDNVEEALGWRRFLLLTLLGTIAGALLHGMMDPRRDVPLIGASAGISAILACYALRFPHARIGWLAWNLSARVYVAIWLGLQLLTAMRQAMGFSSVSAFGHLGGAAVGVAFWAYERRMSAWTSGEEPRS